MTSIRIAIPTLNSAKTLEQTIVSLRSQEGVEVDIVVVDSGSRDGTVDICRRQNVRTLYVEPGNIYRAINLGLAKSGTAWLGYLNSDDWLYHDALKRLIDFGQAEHSDVVYGNCDYVDEHGRFLYPFAAALPAHLPALFRMRMMGFAQPAAIFTNNLYTELDGFDDGYRFKSDAEFFIRALRAGKKFAKLPESSVACFRIQANQLSNMRKDEIDHEGEMIFGNPLMRPRIFDRITLLNWRIKNLPHYLLRILRESLLARRLRLNRSVDRFTDQSG